MDDALLAAAERFMALDYHLHLADMTLEQKIPSPRGSGHDLLKTKKHISLVTSAGEVKRALTPEWEHAKRNLIALINEDDRKRGF